MKKILIIGVGNTLRGDDGAGAAVCDMIATLNLPGITIMKLHQLQTELIEEMLRYDKVFIVDAAIGVNRVNIEKVELLASGIASSHHTDAGVLKSLALKLYNKEFNLYTCGIPAFDFELGETLTDQTQSHINTAVEEIKKWVRVST